MSPKKENKRIERIMKSYDKGESIQIPKNTLLEYTATNTSESVNTNTPQTRSDKIYNIYPLWPEPADHNTTLSSSVKILKEI